MGSKREIKKEINLECLPKKGKYINWVGINNQKINFKYDDIEDFLIIKYCIIENKETFVIFDYKDKEYKLTNHRFYKCEFGSILNRKSKNFRFNIKDIIHNVNSDLIIIDRKTKERIRNDGYVEIQKWYKYKCLKCGFDCGEHYKNGKYKKELWIEESQALKECGCSCCVNQSKIVVKGINDITTTAPWMVKYFQGGYDEAKLYGKSSSNKINPICPDCGRIKNQKVLICNLFKYHSIGCNCSDNQSYISKYMFNLLEQLRNKHQINDFSTEIKFDWCKYYNTFKNKDSFGIYDFVIEDLKTIIETDGGFHRKDNKMNGKTKDESTWIDNMKDKLAEDNGYKVIRVSDEGDIKENIINSELDNIFDLSKIDWDRCGEYACSNLVKDICEFWKLHNEINNENISTNDLEKIFKKNRNTISNYLKQGNQIWCSYDPKEELDKGRRKTSLGKQVEIFKDGISIGKFKNCSDLEKQSEELFGTKLDDGKISMVCRGKRNHHKGFTFKYIK